jgi:hypothetical protein
VNLRAIQFATYATSGKMSGVKKYWSSMTAPQKANAMVTSSDSFVAVDCHAASLSLSMQLRHE